MSDAANAPAAAGLLAAAGGRLRAELAGNPRLRAGAWAVAAILLLYGLLLQGDRVDAAHAAYAAHAAQLARARGLADEDDWPRVLAEQRDRAQALAQRFWQAESPGLAQASLQAAATAIASDLGFREPIVQAGASRPAPDVPGVWQAQAQLSGLYPEGGELGVIRAIAQSPRKLVVDRLLVRRWDTRISVLFSAWFMGVEAPPEAGEGA